MPPDKKKIAADCWRKGTEAMSRENWDYAIDMFGKAAALVPDNLTYRQTLRGCEERKYGNNGSGARMSGMKLMSIRGQIKKSRMKEDWAAMDRAAEEGLKLNPWDPQLNADMAEACQQLGFDEVAVYGLQRAVQRDPTNSAFRRQLAFLLEERGMYTEAMAQWRAIYKQDPNDGEARTKLTSLDAKSVMDRGGYEKAETTQDVREKHDEPIQSAYDLYRPTSKRQPEAVDGPGMSVEADLKRAIRKDPAAVENYLKLADHYKRGQKLKDARETLQQALEASGGDHAVREQLEDVELVLLKENLDVAKHQAGKAKDEQAARKKVAELRRELITREVEVFSSRTERYPKDMHVKVELARRLMKLHKWRQAIPQLQRASSDARYEIDVAVMLGFCFMAEEKKDLARAQYERVVDRIDKHEKEDLFKDCHYYLGRIYEETGDARTAIDHYNDILAVDYEYRDVLKRLENLQSK